MLGLHAIGSSSLQVVLSQEVHVSGSSLEKADRLCTLDPFFPVKQLKSEHYVFAAVCRLSPAWWRTWL
jgi:hypothetical protein